MACHYPTLAYQIPNPATGKSFIKFKPPKTLISGGAQIVHLPCGTCLGCKQDKTRQWKVRLVHEGELHQQNDFLTLTYRPEDLPPGGTLVKEHLSQFMKRLRKRHGNGIRFYGAGQYGGEFGRPHYHVLLFGKQFERTEIVRWNPQPHRCIYRSRELDEPRPGHDEKPLWPYGYSSVGAFTPGSAQYVASYIQERKDGPEADEFYGAEWTTTPSGAKIKKYLKLPEFALMSRGGTHGFGIGADWIDQYYTDCYPKDFVMVGNRRERPPAYYDKRYEQTHPEEYKKIKEKRKAYAQEHPKTAKRLHDKETFIKETKKQIKQYRIIKGGL
jgi:hypothetical protein